MRQINVPILMSSKTVVLGGNTAGLACALHHAQAGEEVLLIEQGTCLYREMDRSACYELTGGEDNACFQRLFPGACLAQEGLMHPDRLKRHGEALCAQAGIRLLYATQVLAFEDRRLLAAHKSGLYAIPCRDVYDCRGLDAPGEEASRIYCLHVMDLPPSLPGPFSLGQTIREGALYIPGDALIRFASGAAGKGHGVMHIPIRGEAPPEAARDRHQVYALALAAFAAAKRLPGLHGLTLARSGAACLFPRDPWAGIRRGPDCPRGLGGPTPAGEVPAELSHINPLYPDRSEAFMPPRVQTQWQGDVVVAGGGTSGAVAAFSAARQGMRVLLLEMNGMLGGTATCGGVSTYWFGTRDGATALIDGRVEALYRELALNRGRCLWNEHDVFLPDIKAHALLSLCLEAGVQVVLEATVCAALWEQGAVKGVAYACGGRLHLAKAAMVIDATGDADVAMLAGAAHTYGTGAGALTYWASLAQYTTPSAYRNNFSTMVHVGCPRDYTRFIIAGRTLGENMYDHGGYVALRESRHIKSMCGVALDGLLAMGQPRDTLYQCFSNYDPKGRVTCDLVYAGLLPPNLMMSVPLGAVIPVKEDGVPIRGLLVGGKAIGCSHDALPGLRMQPDLQQQGFALGVLAAQAIRQRVPAWEAKGVREAVEAAGGQKLVEQLAEAFSPGEMVAALTGRETLEWLDMDPRQAMPRQHPLIACFLAPSETVLPALQHAFALEADGTDRKLLLSRLMLWHGGQAGGPLVISRIQDSLNNTQGLPRRAGPITFGQLLPDHGLMPETVYLLNTLAWCSHPDVPGLFEQVLNRLVREPRDWRDLRSGVYCYVESFAYVAARRGGEAFAPMLRALLDLPELREAREGDLLLSERYFMLRLALGEALARLYDPAGLQVLNVLAGCPIRAIAASARALIEELSHAPGGCPVVRRVF